MRFHLHVGSKKLNKEMYITKHTKNRLIDRKTKLMVNPLQYSCLENLMDRGAWRLQCSGSQKSQIRLKQLNNRAVSSRERGGARQGYGIKRYKPGMKHKQQGCTIALRSTVIIS